MLTGTIAKSFDAIVSITLLDSRLQRVDCGAVVDTGFSDWLTLPPTLIRDLELKPIGQGKVELADGTEKSLETYEANVFWMGQQQRVLAYECDAMPLIGMRLMKGCRLTMDVEPQGSVMIVPLKRSSD